jgi:acyl-CoA synthetase (AMP-forming)/AMP-acid ligase II
VNEPSERVQQKWEPVLRPATRQNKDLEQDDHSKESHLALALSRLLQTGLGQRKDQPALIFEGQVFSYEKLERHVRALAASFNAAGLPGGRVGLMLPNSIELV